jgi:hypothetical protein
MHSGQQVLGVLAFACSHSGVVSCVNALTGEPCISWFCAAVAVRTATEV